MKSLKIGGPGSPLFPLSTVVMSILIERSMVIRIRMTCVMMPFRRSTALLQAVVILSMTFFTGPVKSNVALHFDFELAR